MSRWKLRGCPRCKGDVYIERDNEDAYERCLQCGYSKQIAGLFFNTRTSNVTETVSTTKEPEKILSIVH